MYYICFTINLVSTKSNLNTKILELAFKISSAFQDKKKKRIKFIWDIKMRISSPIIQKFEKSM